MIVPTISILVAILLIATVIKGAPPVPTSKNSVNEIIKMTNAGSGDKVIDLGSGDGRVLIAFAKKGASAEGYEINPFLVLLAKYKIKREGVGDLAKVYWGSFWGKDLSEFNIVNVYGVTHIMKRLGKKLDKELTPGSKVVSNIFPIPGWQEAKKVSGVYLYIKS